MKPSLKDHKVRFTTESEIRAAAIRFRLLTGSLGRPDFNISDCVRFLTRNDLYGWGKLELNYIDSTGWPTAYVVLGSKRSLNIQYEVWREADEGIPQARFIVAHEVGHLVQHDHYAQQFSGEKSKWISFDEESGEWQANKFAEHVLILEDDVHNYVTPLSISIHCAVEYEVAKRRLGKSFKYSGECCQECGNFSLVRKCEWVKCDT